MSEWYYRIDGKSEAGPVGSSKLVELIRAGTIRSDTEIRKGNSKWLRACEVNGLWDAAILPSVLFRCPYCDATIPKPPINCVKCGKHIEKAVGQLVTHPRPTEPGWTQFQRTESKPKEPPLY